MFSYISANNFIALLRLLLDISVVSVVIYYCLKVAKNNVRTIQIIKGILLVFIVHWLAQAFQLKTIEFITTQFLNWGFLVVFIIFQPELRSLLEKLGKTTVFSKLNTLSLMEKEQLVEELVLTTKALSEDHTGALISIEQTNSLDDFILTGTKMDSDVTSELLCSIFVPGTPLHDGAVIIQGNRIACASAYFPPTIRSFPSSYGARHRAAVGVSEIKDCITIVVSEETGRISLAYSGQLHLVSIEQLREYLLDHIEILDKSKADVPESLAQNTPEIFGKLVEPIAIVTRKKKKPSKKKGGIKDAKK